MIKSKKQMFTVIGVFALILMLTTVTYAFFNYTRTGTANTIKTGRIAFNAEQGDTVTLDGLFPITTTGEITASTPGVGSLSIHVTGDTTYNEGIEYLVKAVNVTGSNGTSLPISVKIEYTANNNKTIGTADDSYYTNRGGNSSIYKLLSTDTIENNGDLVVGYIAPGQTGIDGNITIMAWLDAANIAITDTIEGGNIEVPGYDNGTDTDWIDGRTVFTTEEWNALTASGVSFQVKVEANEGIWVPSQLPSTATFDTGTVVNTKLKQIFLTGTPNENANVQTGNYVDYFLVSSNDIIELTDEIPNVENFVEKNIISSADSEETIYAWLDGCDGQYMNSYCKIKIYSPATILYLNADSSNMFRGLMRFDESNLISNLNASRVTNMNRMFSNTYFNNFQSLSNWDVSNVNNMSYMFLNCSGDATYINNWNVVNVSDFTHMFALDVDDSSLSITFPTFTSRPGTWDNSITQINNYDYYSGTYVPNA